MDGKLNRVPARLGDWGSVALRPLAALLDARGDWRPNVLRVLTYHRIDTPVSDGPFAPNTLSATPAFFEEQVAFLADRFHVVSIEQVREAIGGGQPLPPRAVLITFDDAYLDFAEHAWPILQRYLLPAVMFVPTVFPGQPNRKFWWDTLHQIVHNSPCNQRLSTPFGERRLTSRRQRRRVYRDLLSQIRVAPFEQSRRWLEDTEPGKSEHPLTMDWNTLRRLSHAGLSLAPHTHTHPMLDRLPLAEVRTEIRESVAALEREIGTFAPVLAYPGGHFSEQVTAIVREEGIEFAFTTRRGANEVGVTDPFQLRRINIGYRCTLPLLQIQLALSPRTLDRFAICRREQASIRS